MGAAASRAAMAAGMVLLVGACGGGGGDAGGKDARPTTVRVLSHQDLVRAEVGAGDLKGYRTSPLGISINVAMLERITPAACLPIADMTTMASEYQPQAAVEQTVVTTAQEDKKAVEAALVSYAVADAPKVIADLRTSVRTCSSFHFIVDDSESYSDPKPLPDPKVGDEAIAYRVTQHITDDQGDLEVPHTFVVFRTGATIAAFYNYDATDLTKPATMPMDLVTAQADKLARLPALG